jgi:Skp family chaperone for outer membrane proteins
MKKLVLTLLTATILVATAASASAQSKSASVDMKKLFNGYWKFKQSQTILDDRKNSLRKEIKEMSDGADKAQAQYKQLLEQANDQAISADEREKRKQAAADAGKDLNSRKVAIEQFQRQAESGLGELSQRLSGNILTEIQKAVADKAKAGGYTTVVNSAASEIVVYTDASTDLTDAVLKQLHAGAPIDVSKPATVTPPAAK